MKIFNRLTPVEWIADLSATKKAATEILLETGDILYREGDRNDCAYIIEEGEILLHTMVDGERVNLERRGSGSIVGELSILTGKPRTVTVEATRPCKIFKISANQIVSVFKRLDPILTACIETSISFNATLIQKDTAHLEPAPLVPSTLRNSKSVIETFRFENDLIQGIRQHQLHMEYQPIIRLSDLKIVGVEALARWEHPDRGFVPPDRFISVAEEMGTVDQITDLAINEGCKALKKVQAIARAERDFFVSINISGQDLCRKSFAEFLAFTTEKYDLNPEQIKLEVTETALIDDQELAQKNLAKLRSLGCGISVDDFGTGYSNLGYLKSLPLTSLKIDRSFAGDAHANSISRGIVRLVVALGKELNVDVIAEGLETKDDMEVLRALGCAYAQGYHFHRPMKLDDLLAVLASDNTAQKASA